jgi:hypothetical protein
MLLMPSIGKYKDKFETYELDKKILQNFAQDFFVRQADWENEYKKQSNDKVRRVLQKRKE